MVLRTAGRASHPATVRGAGRMRGGSPLGVTSGFRNLLAPAPSGARELPPARAPPPLAGSCQEAGASPGPLSVAPGGQH